MVWKIRASSLVVLMGGRWGYDVLCRYCQDSSVREWESEECLV